MQWLTLGRAINRLRCENARESAAGSWADLTRRGRITWRMITDNVAPLRYGVEPWFMSGFDFRCVWEALGLDHLPFPLAYRNQQDTMAEVEADRRAALARQRAELTENRVRI